MDAPPPGDGPPPDDVRRLYALPGAQFTTARAATARRLRLAGDRAAAAAVLALRRPSRAAALVDRLGAGDPEGIASLLAVADRVRAAVAAGDRPALREATGDQRRVVEQLVAAAARDDVDGTPSAAILERVRATLHAAVVDPEVAREVSDGTLVREAEAGFGALATVLPPLPARPRRAPPRVAPPAARRAPTPAPAPAEDATRGAAEAAAAEEARRADERRAAAQAARVAAARDALAAAETAAAGTAAEAAAAAAAQADARASVDAARAALAEAEMRATAAAGAAQAAAERAAAATARAAAARAALADAEAASG